MTIKQAPVPTERISTLQIVTLILSVYVLIALFVQSVFSLTPETNAFIDRIDFYICIVFLADFFVRLYRATSKPAFLKWGWVDFVSSIPMLDMFRIGRVIRIIRIFRLLRAFRSTKNLLNYFLRDRKATSFAAVATISFMLVVFSSIAVLQFETSSDANIKTPADAFWWAYVTITTVGYGDKFPLSFEGRIVAAILMTAGVGLFGTFTGFVASLFVEPELKEEETDIQQLTLAIQALSAHVQALEVKLNTNTEMANKTLPPPG
jgi:voltage-gated potassium channel